MDRTKPDTAPVGALLDAQTAHANVAWALRTLARYTAALDRALAAYSAWMEENAALGRVAAADEPERLELARRVLAATRLLAGGEIAARGVADEAFAVCARDLFEPRRRVDVERCVAAEVPLLDADGLVRLLEDTTRDGLEAFVVVPHVRARLADVPDLATEAVTAALVAADRQAHDTDATRLARAAGRLAEAIDRAERLGVEALHSEAGGVFAEAEAPAA